MLLLLDISATFNAVDHEILLQQFKVSGGVCDTGQPWHGLGLT